MERYPRRGCDGSNVGCGRALINVYKVIFKFDLYFQSWGGAVGPKLTFLIGVAVSPPYPRRVGAVSLGVSSSSSLTPSASAGRSSKSDCDPSASSTFWWAGIESERQRIVE